MGARVRPEAAGIDPAAITRLLDTLEQRGLDPHALVIARDGRVCFEAAWAPYRLEQPALVYSVSKTYTALAIGMLADEGRLGLDDPVGDLLGIPAPHGQRVRHLLTMNTGHTAAQIGAWDLDIAAMLADPPAHEPGTHFAYNSAATFALSCIVTARTGQRLTDYLRPRLLDPLEITRRWMSPAFGVEQGFSGFHLTAGDLARTAMLLADGGLQGDRQLVPAWYLAELTHPWSDTAPHVGVVAAGAGDPVPAGDASPRVDAVDDWALGYGYQVWRSRIGYRLDGAFGQFGVVDPDRRIAIAYQGATDRTAETLQACWQLLDGVDAPIAHEDASLRALDARARALDAWHGTAADASGPALDASRWRLQPSGDDWTLHIDGLSPVRVGRGSWQRTSVPCAAITDPGPALVAGPEVETGTHLALAARGDADADAVRIELVDTASPHRMLVRVAPDGTVTARWRTPPLRAPRLEALAVPAWAIAD